MGTSKQSGKNYAIDGDVIDFFGAKGTTFGRSWAINAFGGEAWVQVDKDSIMDTVRACIADDVKSGNGDKIAQLQLGARQAVVFYLEGVLTRNHLKKVTEGKDYIDVPDVTVEGRSLTVRIFADPKDPVATADNKGRVL